MKKLTLELDENEFQILQEITNQVIEVKNEDAITDSEINEAIRALILRCYLNEIVPTKYGEDAVVKIKENN
ncbi:hypothetical protein AA0X95_16575 [Bacillus sp. 1P10SD]|uniref:hypothetical protein n=1 Tax=Bacillus sp. 1P10SD TaxID=3132265 RepID=UPI0039A419D2